MGTPEATSILWPEVPPNPSLGSPSVTVKYREEDLPREPWGEGLPPAPAPSMQRSLSTSYLQYSHPLYPTEPRQILQAALPRGRGQRGCECVCVRARGVSRVGAHECTRGRACSSQRDIRL